MRAARPHCFAAAVSGGGGGDLLGNLTLKRMQMRQRINIQRRSLVDLSRCEAISIEDINIQRKRAETQNNTVSKTTTWRARREENKSVLMEALRSHPTGLLLLLLLTGPLMVTLPQLMDERSVTMIGRPFIGFLCLLHIVSLILII